jgi:hypothetical protein
MLCFSVMPFNDVATPFHAHCHTLRGNPVRFLSNRVATVREQEAQRFSDGRRSVWSRPL